MSAYPVGPDGQAGERRGIAHQVVSQALGEPTDPARAFASQHRVAVWQAGEVAQALRGVTLPG